MLSYNCLQDHRISSGEYCLIPVQEEHINLKPLGINTVRILTGEYSKIQAAPAYDADLHISNLDELSDLFNLKML
jgi:hypothetical protein